MKRRIAVAVFLVGAFVPSRAQVPYLYVSPSSYDVPYTFNRFGDNVYILRRTSEAPQSVRMLGLPPGFRGLVSDPLSDWFRNPAYDAGTQSLQLYGDGNDRGQFLGGVMSRLGSSTFGIFASAGGLSDRSSQASGSYTNPPSSSATSNGTDGLAQSLEARALYRQQLGEGLAIGMSYQFANDKADETFDAASFLDPFSSTTTNAGLATVRSTLHAGTLGLYLRIGGGELAVRTRLIRSTPALHEARSYSWTTTTTRTRTSEDQTNDLRATGILGGVEYRIPINEAWNVHTVAEVSHTGYDAPGSRLAESSYGDSVFRSTSTTAGAQTVDGKILDVRIGGAVQHQVGQSFALYSGLVFSYVRHTSVQIEDILIVETNPSIPTITRRSKEQFNLTARAFIIQIPVGAEYAFSSILRFRGGITPQYLLLRREWTRNRAEGTTSTFFATGLETDKSLRFLSTMGVSLYDENLGEMHIAYGVNESGARAWSLSARYIP